LALAGCETMTVSECQVADWQRVGFDDGARGEHHSRLAAHSESCAKAGIRPQPQAYRQGWDNGIARFCTASNGWREGLQGNTSKAGVCNGQWGDESFRRYLEAGLQVRRTQGELQRNDWQLRSLQKQLEEAINDDRKRRLREDMRALDRDQSHLRNQLRRQQMLAP
jgi:hypothetical protein